MEYRINFFTESRMIEFWGYVKMLLLAANPVVMMAVGVIAVGLIFRIVVRVWKQASAARSKGKSADDGDDYEVRHY